MRIKRPLMLFCILIMILSVFKFYMRENKASPGELPETAVTLQGQVDTWEVRDEQTILYLSDILFYGNSATEITNAKSIGIRCYIKGEHPFKLGQKVAVQGFLALPESAGNQGGFDSARYYRSKGYDYVLYDGEILAQGTNYDIILQGLYSFRKYAKVQLYGYLTPEDAGIMSAMLLGDKGGIDAEVKQLYRTIGIYHILAISGLHISMLGGCIYKLLKKLNLKPVWAVTISLSLIIVYGIMIGMPASAFRAIVMFGFGLVAPLLERSHDKLTSMAVAAACLVLSEPLLFFDAGVQLSFLAVLGIVVLYPTFLGIQRHHMKFADGVWVSFAVTYMTLPVIMHTYYEVPLYSLMVNVCVLPFVPVLIGLGIGIIILGGFLSLPSAVSACIIHIILFFYEKLLRFFASLPGNSFVTGAPEAYRICIFYIILGIMIYFILKIKRKLLIRSLQSENAYAEGQQAFYVKEQKSIRKIMLRIHIAQALLMLGLVVFLLMPERFDCRITFLDVGQGDGICVETTEAVWMIDCGSTSEEGVGQYVVAPFLKYKGIKEVDGWFLTHPDNDHISGFVELCKSGENTGITIKTLYIPAVLAEEFTEITDLAVACDIEVVLLEAGDILTDKKITWTVLSPENEVFYKDENAASLVLYLECNNFTGLFMGDAGAEAEDAVMRELGLLSEQNRMNDKVTLTGQIGAEDIRTLTNQDLQAGVTYNVTMLKVAHHGSGIDTNSNEFICGVKPAIAVISCGEKNLYGHPHGEVIDRLTTVQSLVYRTDISGAIGIEINNKIIKIHKYK